MDTNTVVWLCVDCPEREATYVITNGGINDPEKV